MEDDATLLRRYAVQCEDGAFGELVRRHLHMVYGAALRSTDGRSDMAADVAQDTFVRLAREARRLETHPALIGWLYTTARNLAGTAMRSERARKRREAAHGAEAMFNSEDSPGWNEIRPHLEALIDQLDERSRDAIARRFFSGQRFAEIGAALNVSEDAARIRVDRALERLREMLARRKVHCSTSALAGLLLATPAGAAVPAGLAAAVTTAGLAAASKVGGSSTALVQSLGSMKSVGITLCLALLLYIPGLVFERKANDNETLLAALTGSANAPARTLQPRASVIAPAASRAGGSKEVVAKTSPFVPVPMSADEKRAIIERQRALSPKVVRDTTILRDRIRVRLRFHPLYAELRLNPKQIERFETLAAEKQLIFSELIGTPEARIAFRLENVPRTEAVVKESLGEPYLPAFRTFIATSDLRLMTGELAANIFYTDTPLTSVQADLLVQTCVDNCRPETSPMFIDPDTVNWDTVLSRAARFLSPAQIRALRATLAKRTFDLEFKRVTGLPLRVPVRGL